MPSPAAPLATWLKIGVSIFALATVFWLGRSLPLERPQSAPIPAEFELAPDTGGTAFRFTPPRPLQRLVTEWEPQRATVLTMSFAASMSAPQDALFQVHLLEIAHRYNDVLIFSEHDQTQAHAYFLSLINDHPQADAILAKAHFIDSRNLMKWVRDFGPIFGIDRQQNLIALDFVYRNLARDLEEAAFGNRDSFRRFMTLQGDAMPADLAVEIEQRYNVPVDLIRPPLLLDGGDFMHDGRGNVFISTQTLVQNGGNRPALEQVFQLYFGAKKLHVLQALPGATVNHLDMVLKWVDERTVILPDFQANPAADLFNPYRTGLVKQVVERLASNERYLRRHFPDLRIIKMPMPPIQFMSADEVLARAVDDFVRIIALDRKLVTATDFEQLDQNQFRQLRQTTADLIRREVGHADLETPDGFNAVLQAYGHAPLKRLFDIHSETVTRYLSYLNSVFLHNAAGEQAFVVPRFTSRNPAIDQQLKAWEGQAAAAYREARPAARIHWINCDHLVSDSGFIHCMAITVPALPASRL